jgi:hypothetical protein
VKGPSALIAERERSSLMMASAGISHIVVSFHEPWKSSTYCPSRFDSSYSGSWKCESQARKLRLEDLRAAVETVTGQPDHLLLRKLERAGMIELLAQFPSSISSARCTRLVRLISVKVASTSG